MPTITDYLRSETLESIQEAFSAAVQTPVAIVASDRRSEEPPGRAEGKLSVSIRLDGEPIGWVVMEGLPRDAADPRAGDRVRMLRLLGLMAEMLGQLCQREQTLRTRVEELGTLYSLTAEFTGLRDAQEVLDIVAKTVVDVLAAKACSIRLLNEDHTELLVQAVANLSPEYLNKGPILLSQSRIDREVLATGEPVYIADQRTDPRVLYPREAQREGIVSALCVPMIYKGHPEGVLRVYMDRRHEFSWFERSLVQAISAQAAAAIVNARLYQEAIRSEGMRRELYLAGEVQRRMIPTAPPSPPGFEIGALYVPSYGLSGDFYDFIDLPPENLGLAICDVVGKGVRASLLMTSVRASLRAHAVNVYAMSDVLTRVNRDLCADTASSDFATLFYGVLDVGRRQLTYANAGHPPPLLVRGGELCHLSTGGTMLGIDPAGRWRHESFALRAGDVVFAYTDGLSEALNFQDEPFGTERLERAVLSAVELGRSADGIARHVLWEMRRFAGLQTRLDDLTIVVVRAL